jgi:hypothetical protein
VKFEALADANFEKALDLLSVQRAEDCFTRGV